MKHIRAMKEERKYTYSKPYPQVGPYNYILQLDIPELQQLKDILTARYTVRIKYLQGYRSSMIFLNGKLLLWRPNKFGPIEIGDCKLIEGTPLPVGGSNVHPYPTFEEGYCILEAQCDGPPNIDSTYGIEILSIIRDI